MPFSAHFERRLLQTAIAIFALIPITAGGIGVLAGPQAFDASHAADLNLESHFRYLSGLLLAIGLAFWSTIPAIETKRVLCRTLTAIVFVGGLARLYGLFASGSPPLPMLGGLTMELLITPALALWRERIDRLFARP